MKYHRTHVLMCIHPVCLVRYAREVEGVLQDKLISHGLIDDVLRGGLRGRGGAVFPTGRKWQFARVEPGGEHPETLSHRV